MWTPASCLFWNCQSTIVMACTMLCCCRNDDNGTCHYNGIFSMYAYVVFRIYCIMMLCGFAFLRIWQPERPKDLLNCCKNMFIGKYKCQGCTGKVWLLRNPAYNDSLVRILFLRLLCLLVGSWHNCDFIFR